MVALMGGVHVHDRWFVAVDKSLADGNHTADKGEHLDTTNAAAAVDHCLVSSSFVRQVMNYAVAST